MRKYGITKNSIKIFSALSILIMLLFVICIYLLGMRAEDKVAIARIEDKEIYQSELEEKLSEMGQHSPQDAYELPRETLESLVIEIYTDKKLNELANNSAIEKDKEVSKLIEESRLKIMREYYLRFLTKDLVSDEQINKRYQQNLKELKREFDISQLLVKEKEEAESLVETYRNRKESNFSDLIQKFSIDKSKSSLGDGFIREDRIPSELLPHILLLTEGEISEPIETKNGFVILKLNHIKSGKSVSFDSFADNLRKQLVREKFNSFVKQFTKGKKVELMLNTKDQENKKYENSHIKDSELQRQ